MIGIINRHNTKITMMLKDATVPNSVSMVLCVMTNVAKPDAVVALVIRVALPTFAMTRCKDFALLPCLFTSCWYLFIRKIQLGTPMTIIKGGMRAVSTVISYSKEPKIPKVHITPTMTTHIEINVAL